MKFGPDRQSNTQKHPTPMAYSIPTDSFPIWEPHKQEISELYIVQERRGRILKLRNYKGVGRD